MKKISWFVLLVSALLLAACSQQKEEQEVEKENATENKQIRMASWSQPITEQTNILADEETKFFKNEGFDLEFIPGAGGGDAIKNILANNADIAFTDAGSYFNALNQGEDLVAIYNIYPQNVFNVVTKEDSGIERPEDLKGKTIGVYSLASGTRENLLILLHEAGLTEDDVTIVETGLLNFAPLMQGQVDATAATDTGLHIGKQKGLDDYKVFEVKDYLNFSSDLFVVTREYYEENEALLKDFLRAYRSSAEWMMENPQEAAQLAKTYAIDGQDIEQNEAIIDIRNRSSQQSKAEHPLGYIDLEEMQHAIDVYEQLGLIENKIEIEQYVTNDLLP